MEFEYHSRGHWQGEGKGRGGLRFSLKDATDYLDNLGYSCFWAGKKTLYRITGCWDDMYHDHRWSNVACYHRDDKKLGSVMDGIFAKSVPKLKAALEAKHKQMYGAASGAQQQQARGDAAGGNNKIWSRSGGANRRLME